MPLCWLDTLSVCLSHLSLLRPKSKDDLTLSVWLLRITNIYKNACSIKSLLWALESSKWSKVSCSVPEISRSVIRYKVLSYMHLKIYTVDLTCIIQDAHKSLKKHKLMN